LFYPDGTCSTFPLFKFVVELIAVVLLAGVKSVIVSKQQQDSLQENVLDNLGIKPCAFLEFSQLEHIEMFLKLQHLRHVVF
jgi:hypothetical protein